MTPSTDEGQSPSDSEEDQRPTRSHRRRWSSPGAASLSDFAVETLSMNSDSSNGDERRRVSGLNLEGFFVGRRYTFYLGPQLTPWGPLAPPLGTRWRSTMAAVGPRRERTATRKEDFPPYLTTLHSNGRPRFRLRRVKSEGGLEMARVAVEGRQLVMDRGREGLRVGTVIIRSQEEQELHHTNN